MDEVNEIIGRAAAKAAQETSDEPEPQYTGSYHFPVQVSLGAGLDGAIACATEVGYVNGAKGWLVYRGFNCFELSEKSNFEETCYLLLYGRLPKAAELKEFNRKLLSYRAVPQKVIDILKGMPTVRSHPMSSLRTAISLLGMLDEHAEETTAEAEKEIAIKLISQTATLTGAIARIRAGKDPVPPNPELSLAGNFLYMMSGDRPSRMHERIMDISLILHADHGMNASTFTSMVVNSSLSDMYSSVVAGIGSLKGPLHGGANEKVLYDLDEIGSVDNVEKWYLKAREQKRKIMGFGHRVYKAYDPRARILGPLANLMTKSDPTNRKLYETALKLEGVVCKELSEGKKIFPNVDFYSGIIYRCMGIETAMFTPIFAVSRVSGWTARVLEYLTNNRLFRPRAIYTGPIKAEYLPLERRG